MAQTMQTKRAPMVAQTVKSGGASLNGNMFYKIAAIGALIWLVGIIIAGIGFVATRQATILFGIGGIIGGIGVILVALGVFATWKTTNDMFTMLSMIFGISGGVMLLITGILYIANVGGFTVLAISVVSAFLISAFLILFGMTLLGQGKTGLKQVVAIYSLIAGASCLNPIGALTITANFVLAPLMLFYLFMFFRM